MDLLIKKWSVYIGLAAFCLTVLLGLVFEVPLFIILVRAIAAFVVFRVLGQMPVRITVHVVLEELAEYRKAKLSVKKDKPRPRNGTPNLGLEDSKGSEGERKVSSPERKKELVSV